MNIPITEEQLRLARSLRSYEHPTAMLDAFDDKEWGEFHALVPCLRIGTVMSQKLKQIWEFYNNVRYYHPEVVSGLGLLFIIKRHPSGVWLAMPKIPAMTSFYTNNKLLLGIDDDWPTKLAEFVAKWSGIEPDDTIRREMSAILFG